MNINEIEKLYSKYCKIEKRKFPDLSSNIKAIGCGARITKYGI